jgi:hypothetical protein
MAAWPINPFFAKASEQAPLERSPHCSDPDCEYCKELEAALEEVRRHNAKLLTRAGSLRNQSRFGIVRGVIQLPTNFQPDRPDSRLLAARYLSAPPRAFNAGADYGSCALVAQALQSPGNGERGTALRTSGRAFLSRSRDRRTFGLDAKSCPGRPS